ncbi:bifunctional aspartate kinase/diaminopimelate decarboxylase, partial [bacterium]
MPPAAAPWVVLKFGGTSVATVERWGTIASLAERRRAEGLRPLVVCSALSGISNRLEEMLALAVEDRHETVLAEIRERHLELGAALGLEAEDLLGGDLEELSRLALAASLLREAGPRLKARVLAFGELMSTRLGAAFVSSRGLPTAWLDARSCLLAREDPRIGARAYLSATCEHDLDEDLLERLAGEPAAVVLTQGFIARNAA